MPSLLEAIEMKYGVIEHQMCGEGTVTECSESADISIFVPKISPRVCIPSLLVLNDFDIATAGDGSEIEHKCAGVEELDLAMNKLEQWSEVISIFEHMPRLKFANLSFNTLSSPLNKEVDLRWNHLRSLVLNSTYIDWRSVRQLIQLLPELEELHLSFNDYSRVNLEDECIGSDKNECGDCSKNYNHSSSIKSKLSNSQCQISIDDYSIDIDNNDDGDDDDEDATHEDDECGALSDVNPGDFNKNDVINTKIYTASEKMTRPSERKRVVIHEKIKKLHFTGNPIKEWCEICKLGQSFPNLESLVLADCPIESLDIEPREIQLDTNSRINTRNGAATVPASNNKREPHSDFPNLAFLNLNCTAIAEWHEIERLAKFAKLQCLRIQGCPLWESHENTQHERRQLMIARLPNVTVLNGGGEIGPDEREAAERAFIRHFLDTPMEQRPKRYEELTEIHGQLAPLANVDMRPEKRVKVKFTFKDRSEVRSVDVYRTVADLKTKLEPLTGLQAIRMRLFYVDQDLRHIQGPEEMKYANKQLYSYNIRSGDEIIIDQKKRTHSSTST